MIHFRLQTVLNMKTLFFLVMLLCMTACQKSGGPDRSHVGGRVLELGTGEPMLTQLKKATFTLLD